MWDRVGEVTPPHLVLPLTVESSKPRLCHDERYLNLWIRDLPFRLDHLPDLPRYVLPGHFQTSFDDTSGYQHVLLHSSSRTYFGLEWNDVYFVFRTYRLAGRRVPLSIITWVYSLLVQLVRLVFLCRSTSMIAMLASFFVHLLAPV